MKIHNKIINITITKLIHIYSIHLPTITLPLDIMAKYPNLETFSFNFYSKVVGIFVSFKMILSNYPI